MADTNVDFAYLPNLWQAAEVETSVELSLGGALALFLLRKEKDEKSPKTILSYRQRAGALVSHLGAETPLASITFKDLRAWHDTLKERTSRYSTGTSSRPEVTGGLSPVTVREHVRAVRIFFNWLVEEELLENNPAARLKIPSVNIEQKEGITTNDLIEMCLAAKYSGVPRDYALLLFFRDTRCRLGGVVGLTLKRLWVENQEAKVIEKGNRSRKVYFLEDTADALRAWLDARPKAPHNHVFTASKTNEPLLDNGVYRIFEKYAGRAKATGEWNPHAWRHWGSRTWEEAGMPDSIRMQLLGHSLNYGTTTERHYSKLPDVKLRRAFFRYTKVPKKE